MSRCCVALRPPLGTPREEPPRTAPRGAADGRKGLRVAAGTRGALSGGRFRGCPPRGPARPDPNRAMPAARPLGYPARLFPAAVPSQRPHAAHHVDPRRTAVMSRSPAP